MHVVINDVCTSGYFNGLNAMSTREAARVEGQTCMMPLMDNSGASYIGKDREIKAGVDKERDMMEPEKGLKKKTGGSWKNEWFNFSQSTTMHGICKITDDTPFTARRYGW